MCAPKSLRICALRFWETRAPIPFRGLIGGYVPLMFGRSCALPPLPQWRMCAPKIWRFCAPEFPKMCTHPIWTSRRRMCSSPCGEALFLIPSLERTCAPKFWDDVPHPLWWTNLIIRAPGRHHAPSLIEESEPSLLQWKIPTHNVWNICAPSLKDLCPVGSTVPHPIPV